MFQKLPEPLVSFFLNKDATELDLSNNSFKGKYGTIYDTLYYQSRCWVTASKVKALKFANTNISEHDFVSLKAILENLPTCTFLDLSNNNLDQKAFEEIFKCIKDSSVQTLLLKSVTKKLTVDVIKPLVSKCPLVTLDLSGNNATHFEINALQQLLAACDHELEIIIGEIKLTVAEAKRFWIKEHKLKNNKRARSSLLEHLYVNHDDQSINKKSDESNQNSFLECMSLFTTKRKDALLAEIRKQFTPFSATPDQLLTIKKDLRYRNDGRQLAEFPNNLFDGRFLYYGINQLCDGYYLCASPRNVAEIENFLQEITQEKSTVTVIVVVEDWSHSHFNYCEKSKDYNQFAVTSIPKDQVCPNVKTYELLIKDTASQAIKNLTVVRIRGVVNCSFSLKKEDIAFLYTVAVGYDPKQVLLHCETGLALSPLVAFSMQLFRSFTSYFSGNNKDIAKKIVDDITHARNLINPAVFPGIALVVNAVKLSLEYADIHASKISLNTPNLFLQKDVAIKKIFLLTTQPKPDFGLMLENNGIKSYVFHLATQKTAHSELAIKLQLQSVLFQIRKKIITDHVEYLIIDQGIDALSETLPFLTQLPPSLKVLFLKDKNDHSVIHNYQYASRPFLQTIIDGISQQPMNDNIVLAPLYSSATVIIAPLECHDKTFLFNEDFYKYTNNNIHLLNTPENYALLPHLLTQEGVQAVVELLSLERHEITSQLKLKELPIAKPVGKTNSYYFICPAFMGDLKIKDAMTALRVGKEIAARANLLQDLFKVRIISPEHPGQSLDMSYTDKLMEGIIDNIKSLDMVWSNSWCSEPLEMALGKINTVTFFGNKKEVTTFCDTYPEKVESTLK